MRPFQKILKEVALRMTGLPRAAHDLNMFKISPSSVKARDLMPATSGIYELHSKKVLI